MPSGPSDQEMASASSQAESSPQSPNSAAHRRENAALNHQGESVPHTLANSPNQTDMDGTSKDTEPMLPPPDTEKLSPGEGKELIRALRELVAELGSEPQLEACPEPKSLPTTCSQALLLLALPQPPPPTPAPDPQWDHFLKNTAFWVKRPGEHIEHLGLMKQQTQKLQVFTLKAFGGGGLYPLSPETVI